MREKILLVDDDVEFAGLAQTWLVNAGYDVVMEENGKAGLRRVYSTRPNLALLDANMPEMDGYEVIKALKSNPSTANIHIVLMTGVEIDGGRVRALSVGATEYLTKSGGFDKLFETIENILGS